MDLQKVENYLGTIEALCEKLRLEVGTTKPHIRITTNQSESGVTVRQEGRIVAGAPRASQRPLLVTECPQTLDFASRVINDPKWPVAVHPDLLCEPTDEDLTSRAEGVLDIMLDTNLDGLRFLDFGCGLGYMARQALLREGTPASSVGYDITRQGWERFRGVPGLRLTDDPETLEDASYDVILAYDVLDHCEAPVEALHTLRRLLAPTGVLYMRCHPWCSRTGGHLYKQINKAYIHLAINDDILRRLGFEVEPGRKILRPLKTYKEWFAQAGFRVRRENHTPEILENYFRETPLAKAALHRHWDVERNRDASLTEQNVEQILSLHMVDYVLQGGVDGAQ